MSKFISVGKVLNFHGIQGEAKVGFSKNQEEFFCGLTMVFAVFLKVLSSRTSSGGGRKMTGCVGSCFLRQWPLCPGCPPGFLPVFSLLFVIFLRCTAFEEGMEEFS